VNHTFASLTKRAPKARKCRVPLTVAPRIADLDGPPRRPLEANRRATERERSRAWRPAADDHD
jgi:hypothetical protein